MSEFRARFVRRGPRLRIFLVLWLVFAGAAPASGPRVAAAAQTPRILAAAETPRIVAVGDVHGDLPAFKAILVQAGVIDAAGTWTAGSTVLLQLGDLIDRGPSMRSVFDFVMALEQAAAKSGGRVVPLLGNHEVMNITGDLRYVAAASYAEFADAQSETRREDAWKQVADWRKRRAARLHLPAPATDAAEREAWMQSHPPGYVEHAEAFGPAGVYGRWLRGHSAAFVAQGTAFLHGGISPSYAGSPLSDIDRRVHEDLASYDADRRRFVADGVILPFSDLQETLQALREELQALRADDADKEPRKAYERFLDWGAWTINAPDGPLWFRGYAEWSDAQGDAEVPRLLSAFGLSRFVVAHTPQADGHIHVRFGGKVFLIDTGMNTAFFKNGRGTALEIAGDTVRAISSGEPPQVIWEAPAKAAAAVPLPLPDPRVEHAAVLFHGWTP